MPRRCVYYGCSTSEKDLFQWPADPVLAKKWTNFVCLKRIHWKPADAGKTRSLLCARHFDDGSFSNLMKYRAGFAKWLILNKDAVPTIHIQDTDQSESLDTEKNMFSPPTKKGRSAFEKRRRIDMIKTLGSDCNEEEETNLPNESDWLDLDKSVQTEFSKNSIGIQTRKWVQRCTRRHTSRVRRYNPKRSIGIQTRSLR
ncbi:uncharacterized protein LOC141907792 [Tubulanus polymorphus]|uniref:uncharacterized protein LOC141907792 n=1 Tax=Tubulanus polymorphus TaxID=672921 RepID=UPI003DA26CBB